MLDTITRFNQFAAHGKDLDFQRGASAYNRFYGDPTVKPNPCLGQLDKAPFYALEISPGDIGTKGGLVTDEKAHQIKTDGTFILGR